MNRGNDYICLVGLAIPAAIRVVETGRFPWLLIIELVWAAHIPAFAVMLGLAMRWFIRWKTSLRLALISIAVMAALAGSWFLIPYVTRNAYDLTYDVAMTKEEIRKLNGEPDIVVSRESGDEKFEVHKPFRSSEAREAWIYRQPCFADIIEHPVSIFFDDNGGVVDDFISIGAWWKKYKE